MGHTIHSHDGKKLENDPRDRDTLPPGTLPDLPPFLAPEQFFDRLMQALEPRFDRLVDDVEIRITNRTNDVEIGFSMALQEVVTLCRTIGESNQRLDANLQIISQSLTTLRDELRPRITTHEQELSAIRTELQALTARVAALETP